MQTKLACPTAVLRELEICIRKRLLALTLCCCYCQFGVVLYSPHAASQMNVKGDFINLTAAQASSYNGYLIS